MALTAKQKLALRFASKCPRQRMNAELNAMLDEECTLPEMPPVLPPYTYTDPQSGCTALIIACVALSFVAVIAWRLVS